MNQIPDYIWLLEENEDFLNTSRVVISDQEYITLRNNLFSEIAQEETVAFTGNVSKYSREQEVKACLHRYLYLVSEQILSSDDFADNMSFEEKEVRKMRIFDKLEEIYTDIHTSAEGISKEISGNIQDKITNKIRNTLRREPLARAEQEVLNKTRAPVSQENKQCRKIMALNRKMYYLYLDQLFSLQIMESALRNDSDGLYFNSKNLLKAIEDLKQENNKCIWDTFNSMASMKKTLIDQEEKEEESGWTNWMFRVEAPAIERHRKHQKNIENFRSTLSKTITSWMLLKEYHLPRVLADRKVFTNSRILAEIQAKKIAGLFISCVLPYLLIAFFMNNREYIEKIEQWLSTTSTLFKTAYMLPMGIAMGCGYFWKNCSCYGSLKQTYSKKEKKRDLENIGALSFLEMLLVMQFLGFILFNVKPDVDTIPAQSSWILTEILYKEDIVRVLSIITCIHLFVLLLAQVLLHLSNGFAVFKQCYWKNYYTNILFKFLLMAVIIIISYFCTLQYYIYSIEKLTIDLHSTMPLPNLLSLAQVS
ncbi:hypothetical protein NECID01_1636 [Nematocida sp. AWRm77]|nr:hypothetical protein NECID01_1636 [Nematocida sp. AWRm77]